MLVDATWISDSALVCITPTSRCKVPCTTSIRVVSANTEYTKESLEFKYEERIYVDAIFPVRGSIEGGGVIQVVSSQTFADSESFVCTFGSGTSRAHVDGAKINLTTVECLVPAAEVPGKVCVEISNNNVDFSNNCVQFEYTPAATVSRLGQKHGPRTGGTEVTVEGSHFGESSDMRCRFGDKYTDDVRVVSSTTAVCVAPAASASGWVSLEVSNNGGADYTQNGLQYLYVEPARVDYVYPESGPESGGTLLMIGGSNFYSSAELMCHFIGTSDGREVATTKATWISSSALTCVSPPHRPSTIRVAVSSNGQQKTKESVHFAFHTRISVTTVSPAQGSIRGGSSLHLRGTGFTNTTTLSCRFDDMVVFATYVSPTTILCVTPAHARGAVNIGVSNNGVDYSFVGNLIFKFVQIPRVSKIMPRAGPATGGSKLLVTGSGFQDTKHLACRLIVSQTHAAGGKSAAVASDSVARRMPATYISANLLHCTVPDVSAVLPEGGLAEFSVSLDGGVEFSVQQVTFSFTVPPIVSGVSPMIGIEEGGTVVTVLGSHFSNTGDKLMCRFGDSRPATATWKSSLAVQCVSPPYAPGSIVSVEISLNGGIDFSTNRVLFHIVETPRVRAITPNSGPTYGGTRVIIFYVDSSSSVVAAAEHYCRFRRSSAEDKSRVSVISTVVAMLLNRTHLECVAPPRDEVGKVCVEISNNNVDFSNNCVQFEYTPAATVSRLGQKHGPRTGGTEVTVEGSHFGESSDMRCRFGDKYTDDVRVVSSTTAVCVAPAASASGWVSLEVSNNGGADYTQNGLQYLYVEPARVDYVYPESGPESGGTLLMIGGSNFYSSAELMCHFIGTSDGREVATTKATWISSSALTCVSPPHRPSTIRVAVSSNGQQKTKESVHFAFHTRISVTTVFPSRGSHQGGTSVMITGTGFSNASGRLSCRFDETVVLAEFVSETRVSCRSPPWIGNRGTVWVQVSNNGIDFSGDASLDSRNQAVSETDGRGKNSFDFISVSQVLEISPQMGPASGGTRVVISVDELPRAVGDDVGIYCRFTAEDGKSSLMKPAVTEKDAADGLESSKLVCFTPATLPQLLTLELVVGDVDVTFSDSRFLVYTTPTMTDIRPASAHEQGGSTVTIHGSGFKNTNAAFCRFGAHNGENQTAVRATWLAESLLECVVPPATGPGAVSVDVTVNGIDYTASGLSLTYVTQTVIISAWPLSGPAGGGTIVNISGTGFTSQRNASEPPVCIFGRGAHAIHVSAHTFTDSTASCKVPPSPVDLSASADAHNSMQQSALRIFSADLLRSGETPHHDYFSSMQGNLDVPNDVSGNSRTSGIKETSVMFTYIAETIVAALEPAFGPTSGHTVLRLSGASIPTLSQLVVSCVFTGLGLLEPIIVRATPTSNSIAECTTPPVETAGIATVRLAISESADVSLASSTTVVTTTSVQYTFHGEISVQSAAPTLGPESGGTAVTLTLDREPGLASFVPLVCVFGDLPEVPAQYLGSNNVRCNSPPSAPGSVSLSLKTRGVNDSSDNSFSDGFIFVYHDPITVASISPSEALASGGTRIRIQGTNFLNVSSLSCRFGGRAIVQAFFVTSHVVTCTVPAINMNLLEDSTEATKMSAVVSVAVSINGVHWSDVHTKKVVHQSRLLLLAGASSIVSLNPSHGPATGGTDITVTLSSESTPLRPTHGALLYCRFSEVRTKLNGTEDDIVAMDSIIVPALRVSSFSLRCESPSVANKMGLSSSTSAYATVEVSFNGGTDFTSSGTSFGYYAMPMITSMMPHSGSEQGGTLLFITGVHFPRNREQSSVKCRFGPSGPHEKDSELAVDGAWVSPSAIRCVTPAACPWQSPRVSVV